MRPRYNTVFPIMRVCSRATPLGSGIGTSSAARGFSGQDQKKGVPRGGARTLARWVSVSPMRTGAQVSIPDGGGVLPCGCARFLPFEDQAVVRPDRRQIDRRRRQLSSLTSIRNREKSRISCAAVPTCARRTASAAIRPPYLTVDHSGGRRSCGRSANTYCPGRPPLFRAATLPPWNDLPVPDRSRRRGRSQRHPLHRPARNESFEAVPA